MTPVQDSYVRKIASKSDHKWAHHVALLFKAGNIVAVGYNKGEMHAEEMAIRKLLMSGGSAQRIRSIRVRRDGKLGASRPCDDCMKLIRESGIKYIYYSDYDGKEQRMMI